MKRSGIGGKGLLLVAGSVAAIVAAVWYETAWGPGSSPPVMRPDGHATANGPILKKETVDYEAIIKKALMDETRLITEKVSMVVVRDEHLNTSIRWIPYVSSNAHVRVKYDVEYLIGYDLEPGTFAVDGDLRTITITLRRPMQVGRPSIKIISYEVLERGVLTDEKTALLELQKKIEPQAERRGEALLRNTNFIPRSETTLRALLSPILSRHADGSTPPTIVFNYF